ncbi:MAG: FAD-dependent oxidoreductase, partial [Victivallaceae bacterium]
MDNFFDLCIIGGGPGGIAAAQAASSAGLSVALIEKYQLGGTCLNRGCVVTQKLFFAGKELNFPPDTQLYHRHLAETQKLLDQLRNQKRLLLEMSGITIFAGTGYFIDERRIAVSGVDGVKYLSYRYAVISPGRSDAIPLPESFYTPANLLAKPRPHQKLVIVGGGVSGCEFAWIFHKYGHQVVLVEAQEEILPNWERDCVNYLKNCFTASGIAIHCRTTLEQYQTQSPTASEEKHSVFWSCNNLIDLAPLHLERVPEISQIVRRAAPGARGP